MSTTTYVDLPAGTYLLNRRGMRMRIIDMRGTLAHCEWVKRDGTRDARTLGWSGSLLILEWNMAIPGNLGPRAKPRRASFVQAE